MDEETKFCIKCGKKMPKIAKFCPFCGAKQYSANQQNEKSGEIPNESQAVAAESTNNESYRYTAGSHPGMVNSFKLYLSDAFTVSKRMRRADYWWSYLTVVIIQFILSIFTFQWVLAYPILAVDGLDGSIDVGHPIRFVLLVLFSIIFAFFSVANLTSMIRRLHDTGHSGQFLWLLLIPFVGSIAILIMLILESTNRGQRFERKEHLQNWPKKWWPWVIILLLATFYTVTLMLASSAYSYIITH